MPRDVRGGWVWGREKWEGRYVCGYAGATVRDRVVRGGCEPIRVLDRGGGCCQMRRGVSARRRDRTRGVRMSRSGSPCRTRARMRAPCARVPCFLRI